MKRFLILIGIVVCCILFLFANKPSDIIIYDEATLKEEYEYFYEELGEDCSVYSNLSDTLIYACTAYVNKYTDPVQELNFEFVVANKTDQNLEGFHLDFLPNEELSAFVFGSAVPIEDLNKTTLVPCNKKGEFYSNVYSEIAYLLRPDISLSDLPDSFTLKVYWDGREEIKELNFKLQEKNMEIPFPQ